MPKLMTEKETALLVGMSVHWLRRKRWEGGGIPFIKMSKVPPPMKFEPTHHR